MSGIFFVSSNHATISGEYMCTECKNIIFLNKNQLIPLCPQCGFFEFERILGN